MTRSAFPDAAVRLERVERVITEQGAGRTLFRDLDLDIAANVRTAIVGPSGCGKTSLLEIVGLLRAADSGRVLHFGQPVDFRNRHEVDARRAIDIGFVFQSANVFDVQTVDESILDGLRYVPGVDPARCADLVADVADRVGVGHLRRQRLVGLSGGERHRVAFARAIVKSPRLLLCDEPTASLDRHMKETLLDLIDAAVEDLGMSAIIVTHDPQVARRCDVVVDFVEQVRAKP